MQLSRLLPAAIAATAIAVAVCAADAQDRMKLKIATEGAYPPFNTIGPDGKLSGFDIDITNALCARINADCELVAQDWDGLIPGLQAGKFDVIIASMTITEERKKQVAFTDKYYSTPLSLVASKDSDFDSTDPALFAGKVIGVQGATVQADYADEHYGKAGAVVKLYPSWEEAAIDLMDGRTDAVVSDKIQLMNWLAKGGKDCCKMLGDLEGSATEAGISLRLGDDALREKFNAALDTIRSDGTYARIEAKYFSFDIY
ncbi:transporter substrate-binding domain-containing protein [Mesorhizobium sp. BAC0120]|uniref:transporter substrate-binding domain-containing protein n=1 Tax=Mesorhizobium sp. BAC0120 TaxID=3090670 RepID=UPI00298D5E07|nr:transporter substrate-binding domain-containing protein [Mesorhizobium sp. BAC0120]MDW6026236.1 transporter substrate-binding domain-containing protein [Mesorhizobium sp. BAC0120]